MKIRALIFDFGGVLVRMIDDQPRLELAEKLGISLSRLDDLVFNSETSAQASRGEITVKSHWETVRKALGIRAEDMPAFLKQYWSADDVNWKLLDYIRDLHPRYKIGLISNAWDDLRLTMHDRWNIDVLFDEMIISAEVKIEKPDPRIFHLAVERLQVQPDEAIFVDDIYENVEAARKEGLNAIHYQGLPQAIDEINKFLSAR